MNRLLFIATVALLFFSAGMTGAQEFYSSLNNHNRMLINPAYGGLDYESNFAVSSSFYSLSKNQPFREYAMVYDFYSTHLNGGAAVFVKQGFQGETNINTLELGFSYSPRLKRWDGKLTPAVYFGVQQPVKHWFVYGFDEWRNSLEQFENVPGKAYLRSAVYKLGGGLLFRTGKNSLGLSGHYGFQVQKDEKVLSSKRPYRVVAHFGNQSFAKTDGTLARARQISRELLVHFENGLIGAKAEITAAGPLFIYSAFVAGNFTGNLQHIGGSAGFENKTIRMMVAATIGTSLKLDRAVAGATVTLVYKLPTENIKRLMPFKPRND